MAQNGSLYGVLAGFFASIIGTFACGSMVSDKAAHDRPDGSNVGGSTGVGKGGDNGAAAFSGSAGTGGFPGPAPGYGYECLGSGKYRCEGSVVTHELPSGGYPEGTQCTQTILRCEYGCLADGLASDGPPEALCERAIATSSEGGGACPNVPGEGDVPGPLPPSSFDGGTFGCHSERTLAPLDWTQGTGSPPACAETRDRCIYEPNALPCGACAAEGTACGASVYAPCDCGQGAFLDTYWDVWECRCTGGAWDCRVTAPSGSSCFQCATGPRDGGTGPGQP